LVIALDKYSQTKLDFVDTLLYAYNQVTGLPVETFDKDLLRSLQD
jgi:predicted nucleic-acid-binding protein